MLSLNSNKLCALPVASYIVQTDRGYLDFNMKHLSHLARLLGAIGIFKTRRYVVIGASRIFAMVHDAFKKAAPKLDMGTDFQFVQNDDLKNVLEDTGDIPSYVFGDCRGKPYLSTDRRNVWCYERCLSDKNRITQKDLFNPDPWPYEEVDYRTLKLQAPIQRPALQTRTSGLETIAEDDDDDEW